MTSSMTRVTALLLTGLWLTGCDSGRRHSSTPSAALRLAYGRKVHYAPQILAAEKGYFDDEGIQVKEQILQAGIQCAEALRTGAADIGFMGDAPAVLCAAADTPVIIIAAYGGGETMHRIVAGPETKIRTPADLAGARLAVQKGSSTHGALLLFLEKHDITLDSVTLVDLNPNTMPDAVASGAVDAAAGSEPWPSNVEERVEGAREVAVLSGLGNVFPLVAVARRDVVQARPNDVIAVLRAVARGIAAINADPAAAATDLSAVTGVPAPSEQKILTSLQWKIRLDQSVRESLLQTAVFLKTMGRIQSVPDMNTVIDDSVLNQALAEPEENR